MGNNTGPQLKEEADNQASSRKEDHIDLAFKSAVAVTQADARFYYEPMLKGHPDDTLDISLGFLNKRMQYPIWVSSMTGGTEKAKRINHNLGRICGEFGLGMGLGSCRQLLYEDKRIEEFDIRDQMKDQPLFVNLGIAQIEELTEGKALDRIDELISKLRADGLIIHINPLQEWLQPEGDRIKTSPFNLISKLLEVVDYPVIVKEVGQGFGPESLRKLMQLPLAAVDLAGFGGTNFSKLELLRSDEIKLNAYKDVFNLGHSCEQMLEWIEQIKSKNPSGIKCEKIIFSGGIRNFLDGYYFIKKCSHPSFYAQASSFLKYALDYEALRRHVILQIEGLKMAHAFLDVKTYEG
ncbi:MAG: type 2 isopentenyl-diphosphate Delta-isomerase [Saprospiraceae bacterium]|nr:type 2 isopentenyl-diphosphate Delta-isomerase [Saprospiraceae bacterium]